MNTGNLEILARLAHAMVRDLQIQNGETDILTDWDSATEEQKQSTRDAVIFAHQNGPSCHIESHERWMREKLDNGWEYAQVTDKPNKKHSCLVPFSELSIGQQLKDAVFPTLVYGMKDILPLD